MASKRKITLPSKGWGPWRREWYSICSGHTKPVPFDPECPRCTTGKWINVWAQKVEHIFYTLAPDLWRRWVNRKRGKEKFLTSFQKFNQ